MLTKNDITYKATELFEGNESVALPWCNEPSRALQWETPSQITNSNEGAQYMFINTTSIPPTTGKLSARSSMSEL
ncbi:hypothetical protein CI688_05885 [Shigella sonnei]|nr:hypothetical protein CI688_05885 [Shigella sonnei]